MEVSYVYVMVAQLKEIYTLNTIVLSTILLKVLKPQFLKKNITRGPLMAPVIANATLYWSGSILFENHALDSSS